MRRQGTHRSTTRVGNPDYHRVMLANAASVEVLKRANLVSPE